MNDDKIAEIRARHEQVPSGNLSIAAISLAHADRATLLAEVDRLRADVERLTGLSKQLAEGLGDEIRRFDDELLKNDRLDAENDRLLAELSCATSNHDNASLEIERLQNEDTKTRHALKGWVYVCPDGGDEPTHERVAAVVAEVERLREEMQSAKADAWEDGYEAHRQMIEGIARKPSNPYR